MRLKEKILGRKKEVLSHVQSQFCGIPHLSLPSWARATVNGLSKGNGGSLLVCGASGCRENAKGALKSCGKYFIMNSKDQSQSSSLLQGLFLEIL